MTKPRIRVLIADDHPLIRQGLRTLLEQDGEFVTVAEAGNGIEALEMAIEFKPDVILLDVAMPRLSGPDAARKIRERIPAAAIIIVSMHSDESYVLRALNAGASGYLLKTSPDKEVIGAVRSVAEGKTYFSPEIRKVLMEEHIAEMRRRGMEDSYDLLSVREKEIMKILISGKSNRDTAEALFISVATVETHRNNIFQKLNVHNLPELILYAVRKGLIS